MIEEANIDIGGLHAEIEKSIGTTPRDAVRRQGSIALFNDEGNGPPLFWCFNKWVEPVFLANRLGPDQPLFAMRSFHGLAKGKSLKQANTIDFARSYVDEILRIVDDQPIVVKGDCQAAPIAEAIAHDLLGRTGKKALLLTLEHVPFFGCPGSVVLMFGATSEKSNPFLRGENLVPAWTAMHHSTA
ncbi:MAG: hypothetical protein OEY05_16995 [Paracoccaceae bacterium]|nr:hypothetical protein [Paracoccaceae bacterium]